MKRTLAKIGPLQISLLFEPRDAWVGAFVDTAKRRLYLFGIPMLGLVLECKG